MSVFVVSKFLLLLSNIYSNLNSLFHITNCTIKFKCPLRLLWLIVNLSKKIIDQFMGKSFHLNFSNHFNHIRNHLFAFSNVQLECFIVLFALFVVLSCSSPLRFSLIVLSNSKMLISILFISLENDLCILVHNLVRLSNNKGLFTFSSKD